MFWPFVQIDNQLTYCPLADFGAKTLCEGDKIRAKAVIAQPVVAQHALLNAPHVNGSIVLMERGGGCDFLTKVLHAQEAGAVAALIANSCENQHEDAVFVMDCGRRVEEATQVRIPAMMISRKKAAVLFDRIRNGELDHEDFMLTIEFIGAKEAAFVLAEMETDTAHCTNGVQKPSRESQQAQAAKLLRSRLGRDLVDDASKKESQAQIAETVPDGIVSKGDERSSEAVVQPSHQQSFLSTNSSDNCNNTSSNLHQHDNNQSFEYETLTNISSCRSDTSLERPLFRADRTALFVMDMQNFFLTPSSYTMSHFGEQCRNGFQKRENPQGSYCHDRIQSHVLPNVKELLHVCRFHKVEIIYSVIQSLKRNGKDRSRAHKQAGVHLIKKSFDAQIHAHVAPVEDELLLTRTGINVFDVTNLDYLLRNLEIQQLVISGVSHLQSIETMAASALDRGFQVALIRDAIALPSVLSQNAQPESDGGVENQMWSNLEQIGCHISSTRSFLADLLF